MKFSQIFEKDGKYTAKSFKKGYYFNIVHGQLTFIQYINEEFTKYEGDVTVYEGLFRKEYKLITNEDDFFKNHWN